MQAGGDGAAVGAHAEQTLSVAALSPLLYPLGLNDGKAHVVRVRYTPGHHLHMLEEGPNADVNHMRYWIEEGMVRAAWSKWPSWRGHTWPPRAPQTASEGVGLPSALVRRGPAPQIPLGGRALPAKGRPSRHFRCV